MMMGTAIKQNHILPSLALIFLILFVYSSIVHPLVEQWIVLPKIPGGIGIKTIFMLFFSIFHAWHVLGWRHTLVFFVFTVMISWGYEQVGVESSLIYGAYHYTDALGTKLGHVPIIIPIAWFMMIYPSYIIANLIAYGRFTVNKISVKQIVLLSILSAVVMTAWDFVIDPYLSGPTQEAWIWEANGPYFGVPLHNFGGWLLTTFTIYLLYRLFEHKVDLPLRGNFSFYITLMPLVAYGAMMLANIIPGEPPELRIIGPIVMGIPLILAVIRLLSRKSVHKTDYTYY